MVFFVAVVLFFLHYCFSESVLASSPVSRTHFLPDITVYNISYYVSYSCEMARGFVLHFIHNRINSADPGCPQCTSVENVFALSLTSAACFSDNSSFS